MPACCCLVHRVRGRTPLGNGRGGLPAAARTGVHLHVIQNASVILNLSRWRNAIGFIDPAVVTQSVVGIALGRPCNASGQQAVKAYNFPMLVLFVGLRGNNETGPSNPHPAVVNRAQVTKWLTCLT